MKAAIKTRLLPRNLFELLEPIEINVNDVIVFTVPAGYVSDMAGIPSGLHWWIRPTDTRIARGAIAHDFCYHTHILPRGLSDSLFQTIIREDGCSRRKAKIMSWVLNLFGKFAYMRGPDKMCARTPELKRLVHATNKIEQHK